MQLKQDSVQTHLSHYFHLISAYELSQERFDDLIEEIKEAQTIAQTTGKSVIVTQDSHDHILVVHPSKSITLYALMGTYETIPPEN